jgi:hypothetical protein
MSQDSAKSGARVSIWVPAMPFEQERDAAPPFRIRGREIPLKEVKVDPAVISQSLSELIRALDPALGEAAPNSKLKVDELELNLTLSATGEVGFIASLSGTAEASITVRLKRQ